MSNPNDVKANASDTKVPSQRAKKRIEVFGEEGAPTPADATESAQVAAEDSDEGRAPSEAQANSKPLAYVILDGAALVVTGLASIASVLCLVGLFAVGFKVMGRGIYQALSSIDGTHQGEEVFTECIKDSLHGLELLLLAPLAYFLLRSLAVYMSEMKFNDRPGPMARASLVEVKALIVGLLAGVVATSLVGQALSEAQGLDSKDLIKVLVLVVLLAHFYGLERWAFFVSQEVEAKAKRTEP